jgi:hypothetical protein
MHNGFSNLNQLVSLNSTITGAPMEDTQEDSTYTAQRELNTYVGSDHNQQDLWNINGDLFDLNQLLSLNQRRSLSEDLQYDLTFPSIERFHRAPALTHNDFWDINGDCFDLNQLLSLNSAITVATGEGGEREPNLSSTQDISTYLNSAQGQ